MNVKGLTTATTIWISAAIGMSIGIGQYQLAFAALIIVMLVLLSFTWIQKLIERTNKIETYTISFVQSNKFDFDDLIKLIQEYHLTSSISKKIKTQNKYTGIFSIQGTLDNHEQLIQALYESEYIIEFEV
jgi:putative Mg2+ transporter-C (MgtC) family protein